MRLIPAAAALAILAAIALSPRPCAAEGGTGDMTAWDPGVSSVPDPVPAKKASSPSLLLPLGPFWFERGPEVDLNVVFPLVFHRKVKGPSPSTFLAVSPLYWYYRAGKNAEKKADALFPIYFGYADRLKGFDAAVVPPFFLERWKGDGSFRAGLAPVFFLQRTPKLDYTVIPPVFWHFAGEKRTFVWSLLFFFHKKGTKTDIALPPVYFQGWNDRRSYFVLFPLAWHFDKFLLEQTDTVIPPVWFGSRQDGWRFLLAPVLYLRGGKGGGQVDIIPILHWDHRDGGTRVVVPPALAWYWSNPEKKVKGGGGLLYHRYTHGSFTFQMFMPLWFNWSDRNMMHRSHIVVPVGYFDWSPIHRNISILGLWWDFHSFDEHRTFVLLPLFAHSMDLYRENHTTWVFPTFQYTKKAKEWQFNIHPVMYLKGGTPRNYQVFFPVWWRFAKPGKIAQIAFPFWWDFQDLESGKRASVLFPLAVHVKKPSGKQTMVLNTYHWKGSGEGKAYRFVFFPLMGFGENQAKQEKYWKILLGFLGWRTTALKDTLYFFWIPIKVKDRTPPPSVEPEAPAPAASGGDDGQVDGNEGYEVDEPGAGGEAGEDESGEGEEEVGGDEGEDEGGEEGDVEDEEEDDGGDGAAGAAPGDDTEDEEEEDEE